MLPAPLRVGSIRRILKESTEGNSIRMYMDPQMDLVFPMVQHIGAPCVPTVKKGEYVLRGQKIGEAQGFVIQSDTFQCIRQS